VKEKLLKLIGEDYNQKEIAKNFGVTIKTVTKWFKKYNIKYAPRPYRGKNMQKYYDARILRASSYSCHKIAEILGINWARIYDWVKDIPCKAEVTRPNYKKKKDLYEAAGRSTIRRELIKFRGGKCEECGLATWRDQPIPLQVHHIDGNKKNNDLKNLVVLCRNCHGLTKNFGNRKRELLEKATG
jgi:transposase